MSKIVTDRRALATAMIGVVVVMMAQGVVVPHINLKVFHGYGILWVSFLTFGFMIARSFASLFHAVLYNTISVRFTGILGIALLSLCYVLYKISPIWAYPLIRILEGFAAGIFWPLLQSLVTIGSTRNWRSRMMSIYFIIGTIAGYIGYQVGSVIYRIGPEKITTSGLILLLSYAVFYATTSPNPMKTDGKISFRRSTIEILREVPNIKKYIPFIVLNGGVGGLMKDYLFVYAAMITGYPEPSIRNYWSVMGYIGLAMGLLFSYFYESKRREKEVLIISSSMTLSVFLLPLARNPIWMLFILALISAGTRTLRPVLRGAVSKLTKKPEYGIALVNSLSNLSAGLIPLLISGFTLWILPGAP